MSAFVLLRAEEHQLALTAASVERFDRGSEGQLLLGEPEEAAWVVALTDGQRWRTRARPKLAELHGVQPLPPMLVRWGASLGIEGCARLEGGMLLVVTPAFARGGSQ